MATGSSTMVTVDSDGGLAFGTLAGDKAAFAALYDRFASRIHDFHLALSLDPGQASEATFHTFERAVAELNHLGEPTGLRPWLYALAYRQSSPPRWRRRIEQRPASTGECPQSSLWRAVPHDLTRLDRALLTLLLRHGVSDTELGGIVGLSSDRAILRFGELRPRIEPGLTHPVRRRTPGPEDCLDPAEHGGPVR